MKELSFKAIEEGICYLKVPVTNKYINENFSMDLIGIHEDRRQDFMTMFKDLIIGVRDNDTMLYNKVLEEGTYNIPIALNSNIKGITLKITSYFGGMITSTHTFEYTGNNSCEPFSSEYYTINVQTSSLTETIVNEDDTTDYVQSNLDVELTEDEKEKFNEKMTIEIKGKGEKISLFRFNVELFQKGDGKIIFRNCGLSCVAPDGGLAAEMCAIASKNGVQVHKIDPKADEIAKGGIARFNPLLVGDAEKTGDIISSILISMDSNGKDSNPYFKNASIRAVRSLVILLKVAYEPVKNKKPTLEDVLHMLNNFNLVIPYVEYLKRDLNLSQRWKNIIDYFETCFYPQPLNEATKKPLEGEVQGSKRKKTEEAISGIINQLDNFLGREEIKYILCDRENSINLSEVLEKGECIAVATRQSELGEVLGKAFALFLILSLQNAALCRFSEDENPEVPHFLYIDEFPFYVNDNTKVFFTFARKYKIATTVAIQNMAQLKEESDVFREVVFTNCNTKIVLAGANVEDREYYSEFFGFREVFETQTGVSSNPIISEKASYSESSKGALKEKANVSKQELAELKFKRCYYSYTNPKGITKVGKGYVDFVKLTDENTMKIQHYDFAKFKDILQEDIQTIDKKLIYTNTHTINTAKEDKITAVASDFSIEELDELAKRLDTFGEEGVTIVTNEVKEEIAPANSSEEVCNKELTVPSNNIINKSNTKRDRELLDFDNFSENELLQCIKNVENENNTITNENTNNKNVEECATLDSKKNTIQLENLCCIDENIDLESLLLDNIEIDGIEK
ncbi:MAG: TraM recognition domain-containing protein [Candidatus Woesearchaeota archaeon]